MRGGGGGGLFGHDDASQYKDQGLPAYNKQVDHRSITFRRDSRAEVMGGLEVFTSLFPHIPPACREDRPTVETGDGHAFSAGGEICGTTSSTPLVVPALVEKEGLCRGGSGRFA